MRILIRSIATALCLCLAIAASASAELTLGKSNFEWPDADNENAYFSWFAEVINSADTEVTVDVSAVLLDDDDRVVHTDTTQERVPAGATLRVSHEGSLDYARAQDVVSYRFDVEPAAQR
ncbi:MAG: hypothetical protein GKS06_16895 [Acidobacteria bacterium]|nr:hypothetical protein [Acidobacteriota bacterium]